MVVLSTKRAARWTKWNKRALFPTKPTFLGEEHYYFAFWALRRAVSSLWKARAFFICSV